MENQTDLFSGQYQINLIPVGDMPVHSDSYSYGGFLVINILLIFLLLRLFLVNR